MYYSFYINRASKKIKLHNCCNLYLIVFSFLVIFSCNAIEENNLDQEKLPSYKEAKKMIQIDQCLSDLKNPPPDYNTVVNADNNNLNLTEIDINTTENNSNLNNNSLSLVINKYHKCIYSSFTIAWIVSIVIVAVVLIKKNVSILRILIVISMFMLVHYSITRMYRKKYNIAN